MKVRLILLGVFCLSNAVAQTIKQLKPQEVHLNGKRSHLYLEESWDQNQLKSKMQDFPSDGIAKIFGADSTEDRQLSIPVFRRYVNKDFLKEQKDCGEEEWEVYRTCLREPTFQQLETWDEKYLYFDQFRKKRSPSCYYLYRQYAPLLDFSINLLTTSPSLLKDVEVEVLYRSQSQGTGLLKRRANADLLIPLNRKGEGWETCLNPAKTDFLPFYAESGPFIFSQLIWSEHYFRTLPGKLPPKESFILRFRFIFEDQSPDEIHVLSPWMLMEI